MTESALVTYRDDGPLARALGAAAPPLPPIALIVAGALPPAVAAAAGAGRGLAVASICWLVLLAGLSGGRVGAGRLRWAVLPALRAAEYGAILWLAGSAGAAAAFALLAAVALRQYDTVYGRRRSNVVTGGWDGRLLLTCALVLAGAVVPGLFIAAGLLALATAAQSVAAWSTAR